MLLGSGQILPQALPLRAAVTLPLPSLAPPCLSQLPELIPRFRRVSAGLLPKHYFFFLVAFLAFLFFAITGLHQRLKEAKHEARPYCDGLFDCRNEPQRTESFRLSTSGASGLEEKFVFNMSQSAKNILGGLHIIRKAARAILIADRRASDHFLFARVGKIARNDRVVPLTARRKLGKGPGSERFVWIGRSAR